MATTSTTNSTMSMNTPQMSQIPPSPNQPISSIHHQSLQHPPKSLTPNQMNSPQIPPNHYDPNNLNHNQMMNSMTGHPMASPQYNLNYHQQGKF